MNQLCARLDIDWPIIQSGMGGVAGTDLAAGVCNAGGLGVLAALMMPPDLLRDQIRDLRRRTDRPFGVNIWLHDELSPPVPPVQLPKDLADRVRGVLDGIRFDAGLPGRTGEIDPIPDLVDAAIDVMIDERIPVFSAGVGMPSAELVDRFHGVGSIVVTMVATVDDAVEAVGRGSDVVVAQGAEAGGHRSVGSKPAAVDAKGVGTMVLVPSVRDAVGPEVPLAAAGGIVDGRGVAAAIALGADGVLLGSRFVATQESGAAAAWKQAMLDHDRPTVLTDSLTGQWARTLRNDFVTTYDAAAPGTLPSLLQASAASDIHAWGREHGDPELMPLYAGEGARLLGDLPSVADVIAPLVADAERILGRSLR
jgi:nitronate monooxygenase